MQEQMAKTRPSSSRNRRSELDRGKVKSNGKRLWRHLAIKIDKELSTETNVEFLEKWSKRVCEQAIEQGKSAGAIRMTKNHGAIGGSWAYRGAVIDEVL